MLFLERIDRRLDELDKVTIMGDQIGRYRVLHTLFIDTYFKYPDAEGDINKEFTLVKTTLASAAPTRSGLVQHQQIVFGEAEDALDKLHLKLSKLLYDNDLIYLKKKNVVAPEIEVAQDY